MTYMIKAALALALGVASAGASAVAQDAPALAPLESSLAPMESSQGASDLRPLDEAAFEELQRVTTSFELRAGETLRQALTRWAADSGWQVIWQSSKDYRIEASLVFPRGTDFKEAARSTARSIWRVNPTLKLKAYRNNVMVVEEVQG